MWMEARGQSMWPLLLPGDRLQVERCSPEAFIVGDIAVMSRADGMLVCHGVVSLQPFATASTTGRIDEPLEPLARVIEVKRGRWKMPLSPYATRAAMKLYATVARSPAQLVWQAAIGAATSPATNSLRAGLLGPVLAPIGREDLQEVALFLSRWASPGAETLERALINGRNAGIRLRGGKLAGLAMFYDGALQHLVLLRRLQGLGLEAQLEQAVT